MAAPPNVDTPKVNWGIPLSLAVLVGGLVVYRAITGRGDAPPDAALAPSASAIASSAPSAAPPAARCVDLSEPFLIGEPPARRAPPPEPVVEAGPPDEKAEEPEDDLAPFAVEVGRGAAYDGGFAAGVRRDSEGSAIAMVATLGRDGRDGKLIKLARTRGDLDPPVVAGAGSAVLAAMLEPNAGGRSIKVAKVTGGDVTWGLELSEGRDDSLALDIAASGARALVVWDDVPAAGKHSSVMLASFDVATMRASTGSRPVTAPKADADTPRLVVRQGGYWLGYVARSEQAQKPSKPVPSKGPTPEKTIQRGGPKLAAPKPEDDDSDDELGGETITYAWVEVMPLDENGVPTAEPRAVTPKDGHALAFDLELGEDGGALVAWRDDDAPTGSGGGRISAALLRLGGTIETHVLAEESFGAGVPDLLPGWLVVSGVSGATRLAAISAKGEMKGPLDPEPALGSGEPLAAAQDRILLARPLGRAMRLGVVRCAPAP